MNKCSEIKRYQNKINQGGHPIALVSIVTTLCEKSLYTQDSASCTVLRQARWTITVVLTFLVEAGGGGPQPALSIDSRSAESSNMLFPAS